MTWQQKVWRGGRCVVYSMTPLILYLFIPGLAMNIGKFIRRYRFSNESFFLESGNFYTFVSLLVIAWYLYKQSKKNGSSIWEDTTFDLSPLKDSPSERKFAVACLMFGFSTSLLLSSLLTLIPFPSWLMDSYRSNTRLAFEGRDLILVLLNIGFLAPTLEEILFRGYMLNRQMTFFTEKQAVIITSAIFALCHVSPLWMIYSFLMGVLLAKISIKKDNLLPSVCIHIGFNLPSVLIAVIQSVNGGSQNVFGSPFLIFLYGAIGAVSARLLLLEMKGAMDI